MPSRTSSCQTGRVPLRGRSLLALRAVTDASGGLRIFAYPSVMPLLVQLALVEKRSASRSVHRDGEAWFLTALGRIVAREYGQREI